MRFELAIFDLDGLLVDSEPHKFKAWRDALRAHGSELTEEEFADQWVNMGFSSETVIRNHHLEDVSPEALRAEVSKTYLPLIENELKPMPGAMRSLELLKRAGICMALGTSSYHVYVDKIIVKFDLGRYFEVVVTSTDIKAVKPAPDIFLECARRLNVDPDRCLVFEDAVKGLLAAHAAGMRCLIVPTAYTKNGDFEAADILLKSLEEFDVGMMGRP